MPMQQTLLQEGISIFRHVTTIDGSILDWQYRAVQELSPTWQRSYTKLILNLTLITLPNTPLPKKQFMFIASLPLQEDCSIWQLELTRVERVQRWLPGEMIHSARHIFRFTKGLLAHAFRSKPPQNMVLMQLISAPNWGHDANRYLTIILGSVFDPVGQTNLYMWRDGTKIFLTGVSFDCSRHQSIQPCILVLTSGLSSLLGSRIIHHFGLHCGRIIEPLLRIASCGNFYTKSLQRTIGGSPQRARLNLKPGASTIQIRNQKM